MAVSVQIIMDAIRNSQKKIDFFSLYEEMETDNADLVANKAFWSRKGNSQKYTCSLCNISVQMSQNVNLVKTSILAHLKDKYHKKKFDTYIAQNSSNIKSTANHTLSKSLTKGSTSEPGSNYIDKTPLCSEQREEIIASDSVHNAAKEKSQTTEHNKNEKQLFDLDTIYNTFLKINPVIKTSKQFITKHKDGTHYICTLCNILVFNSLNANEFRYNLWVHLNEDNHRNMLPNFNEVQKEFNTVITNLSETIPNNLKDDMKYFEIGPVFRFLKCSLCEIAVSVNLHRLSNHLNSEDHQQRKALKKNGKEIKESLPNRTRDAFRKLVVKIEDKFKKEIKYIQIGKMPGYIICSLCTYVVLPTQFYLQTHFESDVHVNNKRNSIIKKQAKAGLDDLLKTLPEDLQHYNIFEENICGLTCKRCKESIPATSYDLYTHINKERHVPVMV